ncbi:VOC family protein [Streptomyces sp. NPDC019443]|uniref:VOC family protein n=1 Tax=Streptomyces sp. NPDC019443 TaxID=3365061 RepID=UPI00378F157A
MRRAEGERAARFFATVMGLEYTDPDRHFAPVRVNESLTLDFLTVPEPPGSHLAFDVDPATFDAVLARLRAAAIPYGNDPVTPDNGRTRSPAVPLYELMSPAYGSCRISQLMA